MLAILFFHVYYVKIKINLKCYVIDNDKIKLDVSANKALLFFEIVETFIWNHQIHPLNMKIEEFFAIFS